MENPNITEKSWRTPPEPVAESEIIRTLSADVVIVGAGHAGTAASRAAAESGASVIVLDKQREDRFRVRGFEIGNINSALGRSRGMPQFDPLDFVREWQRRTLGRSDPELIMRFAKNSGDTLDWFCKPLDQRIIDSMFFFMQTPPAEAKAEINGVYGFLGTAIFRGDPGYELPEAVKQNQAYARELGAQYIYQADALYLEKDGDRVSAVICRTPEGCIRVSAGKGVLLAAGDFSLNKPMMRELCTETYDLCMGGDIMGMGWDGRGIQLGLWAGGIIEARPVPMMGAVSTGVNCPLGSTAGFLMLNREGKRFCDEGSSFSGSRGARQPMGRMSCIWDSNWRKVLDRQGLDHGAMYVDSPEPTFSDVVKTMEGAVGAGAEGCRYQSPTGPSYKIWSADTIEDLASYLGYEGEAAENFAASVRRYNELCETGRDEDFAKDAHLMLPVIKPPFFGVVGNKAPGGMALSTVGGLWINSKQQVLDANLEPVKGLYASGDTSGCRFGFQYMTPVAGLGIGMATTLGRLAGYDIAAL